MPTQKAVIYMSFQNKCSNNSNLSLTTRRGSERRAACLARCPRRLQHGWRACGRRGCGATQSPHTCLAAAAAAHAPTLPNANLQASQTGPVPAPSLPCTARSPHPGSARQSPAAAAPGTGGWGHERRERPRNLGGSRQCSRRPHPSHPPPVLRAPLCLCPAAWSDPLPSKQPATHTHSSPVPASSPPPSRTPTVSSVLMRRSSASDTEQ